MKKSDWLDRDYALKLWQDKDYETLMAKLHPIICGVAWSKSYPILDREDAIQDAKLRVYQRLQTHFDPTKGGLVSFVIRVASQAVWDHCSDQTLQTHMFESVQTPEWFDAPTEESTQDDSNTMTDFCRAIRSVQATEIPLTWVDACPKLINTLIHYGPMNQIDLAKHCEIGYHTLGKLLQLIKKEYKQTRHYNPEGKP
jgi:DNA-directed RNA polymerase specialized sigma24 family protein